MYLTVSVSIFNCCLEADPVLVILFMPVNRRNKCILCLCILRPFPVHRSLVQ